MEALVMPSKLDTGAESFSGIYGAFQEEISQIQQFMLQYVNDTVQS